MAMIYTNTSSRRTRRKQHLKNRAAYEEQQRSYGNDPRKKYKPSEKISGFSVVGNINKRVGYDDHDKIPSLNPKQVSSMYKTKIKYTGEMAEREKKAQEEIAYKKTCVASLHKSNFIYVTPGINPSGLGRKNETL